MMDVTTFLLTLLYLLGSILLVVLIVLGVKLINTINRLNGMIDEVNVRISKFDKLFHLVDAITDNLAMVSDKMVDGLSYFIRKIFGGKFKRKEEDTNE